MTYEINELGDKIIIKNAIKREKNILYYITGQGDIGATGMTKESRKIVCKMKTTTFNGKGKK